MKTLKNNGKGMWARSALCLVALGLAGGTGCDLQGTDTESAMEAASNPSTAMARLFNLVIETRLEKADSFARTRPDAAEQVGITLLR